MSNTRQKTNQEPMRRKTTTRKNKTQTKKEVEPKKEIEISQEFIENKKEDSIVIKIINIILWILLFVWMGICLFDFFKVKQEKKPVFCIKEETIQYEDGTVETCLGLGYRTYEYKRESYKGYEFGPFWTKDKSDKED